jgi:hypothetical protein
MKSIASSVLTIPALLIMSLAACSSAPEETKEPNGQDPAAGATSEATTSGAACLSAGLGVLGGGTWFLSCAAAAARASRDPQTGLLMGLCIVASASSTASSTITYCDGKCVGNDGYCGAVNILKAKTDFRPTHRFELKSRCVGTARYSRWVQIAGSTLTPSKEYRDGDCTCTRNCPTTPG